MVKVQGTLTPRAPFDFSQSLRFLSSFMPMYGQQVIASDSLSKAMYVNGQLITFKVEDAGTADKPKLAYTLYSERELSAAEQKKAVDQISFYLSIDDDLTPFYEVGRDDPSFEPVIEKLFGYHQIKFSLTPFENACWAVLTQRNMMSIAAKMKAALTAKYGGTMTVDGVVYRAFPEPGRIAEAGEKELAEVIGHNQKADFLAAVARAFFAVDDDWLHTAPDDEVERWLRSIKGIGEWSATFVMIRGLGRTERVSVEKRLLAAASEVYKRPLDEKAVKQIAAPYGEYQGYWAVYLRAAS